MTTAQLNDRAVVSVEGPDAEGFLQNVVTLDLASVDRNGIGYGALLTPQGKIMWDFVLHKSADGYAFDVRGDEVPAFAKRLAIYKLRAKVTLAPAPELAVFAEWPAGEGHPTDPRLSELGSRWIAPAGSVDTNASTADWHNHRIALAIPEGGIDFVFGDTFPSDAAMDVLHGVAYDKGCFIGQEVVSRMRHRGTARRRIVAVQAEADLPAPGADVTADGRPVGRLGSFAGGRGIALVRLDRLGQALADDLPVAVGDIAVTTALPDWATYSWPAAAGADS